MLTASKRQVILAKKPSPPSGGGGGGGALVWTKSIDPATYNQFPNYSASSHTLSACPIGTASADRWVEVTVFCKAVSDPTGCTIGGVSATLRAGGFQLSSNNMRISVYGAKVTTGTTADVVVSFSGTACEYIAIAGGYFTGNASMTEDGTEVTQDGTYMDFTLPSKTPNANGAMIVSIGGYNTATYTPTWGSGMAGDYSAFISGWGAVCTLGHATTLGASVTPSITGPSDAVGTGCAVGYV